MNKETFMDRVEVRMSYEDAVRALNMLQFSEGERMTSSHNKYVSRIRHRFHVAMGEADAAQRQSNEQQLPLNPRGARTS